MPRYALGDEEMKALIGYLRTLSADPAPGVSEEEIHFATVIQPGEEPAKRRAMLEVMQAFVRDKNAGTRSEVQRREAGTEREYRAYRKWVLHVWELSGPAEGWGAQLDAPILVADRRERLGAVQAVWNGSGWAAAWLVSRSEADFFTQSRDVTDIRINQVLEDKRIGDTPVSYGEVHVSRQVVAFVRKTHSGQETIDTVALDLPAQTLETKALWFSVPLSVIGRAALTPPQIPGAAHAAEHAAIGLLPLIATCDRWDIGGVSTAFHQDTDSCAIFIYDGYQGGAGIAERGYRSAERLLSATLETVKGCGCALGCPSCVQSPKCGNGNEPLDKAGAASLIAAILGEVWG